FPPVAESVTVEGPGASGHRRRGSREAKDSSGDGGNNASNGLPEENMFFMRKQNSKGRGGSGGRFKDNVAAAASGAAEGRVREQHERSSSRTRLHDRTTEQQGPPGVGAAEAARLRDASEERRSYGRSIAAAAKAVANPGYADSACGSVVILDRESGKGLSVLNPYDEVDVDRTGSGSGSGNKAAIFAATPSAVSSGRGDGRPSAVAAATGATGRSGSRERSNSSGLRQQEKRRPSSPAGHIHTA
ncbi:unnamed protein product, partial [Ectocarpus sp. 12 AP-2014]